MNARIIKKVLNRKHEDFMQSIDDPAVRKLMHENSLVTGGSIASMLLNEPVNDYDYYFINFETAKIVAEYYCKKFIEMNPKRNIQPKVIVNDDRVKIHIASAGIAGEGNAVDCENLEQGTQQGTDYVNRMLSESDETDAAPMEDEKPNYRPVFLSANAITLSNKIQLIIRFYGEADEIHKNYDFTHCTCSWKPNGNELILRPEAMESMLSKHLVYMGSKYPVASVIRTRKFIKRGWHINAGQYLKMCFQISELNLNDLETIDDQLTGVDQAYFREIIDYCKKRQESDPKFKVTAPYLASIVDKIF